MATQIDVRPAAAMRAGRLRLALFGLAATLAVNAAFLLVVDRIATTETHLKVSMQGGIARATLGDSPESVWNDAPGEAGRIAIAITQPRAGGLSAGIDNLVVRSHAGKILAESDFGSGAPPTWASIPGWGVDHRRHLVAEGQAGLLWIADVQCGDCVLDVDLIDVRGVDVVLRAPDERAGIVLRWDGEALTWHVRADGRLGDPQMVLHPPPSRERGADLYAAELGTLLLGAYVDGWLFVWWYLRAALPGIVLLLVLGAGWRLVRRTAVAAGAGVRWRGIGRWGAVVTATAATPIALYLRGSVATGPSLVFALVCASLVLAVGAGIVVGAQELRAPGRPDRRHTAATALVWGVVLALASGAAGFSAYVAAVYLEGIPHVQDSVSYLLGAKTIAAGGLRTPIDPALGPFFDLGQFFQYHDGYMYPLVPGLYFPGHPALLALGVLVGAPWIINPISSGLAIILLFLLGRTLFGTTTGLLAAALLALSPFARFQSASMMTHPSVLLFTIAALLCLVYWMRQRRGLPALGLGACLGAILNIRPYEGAVLGAFVLLIILCSSRQLGLSRLIHGLFFAGIGVAPFLLVFVWWGMALTQTDASTANLAAPHPAFWTLFEWIPENLDHSRIRLDALNRDLFGWPTTPGVPARLSIGLLLVALLVMPKTRADWLVAGWAVLFVAAYASYPWHGNMFGPRYYYPSLGGQLLLISRLLHRLPEAVARFGARVWPPGGTERWRWLPWTLGALPLAVVVAPLLWGTLSIAYPNAYRQEYGGAYNGFSAAPLRLLRDHGVTRGLIFIADGPQWQHLVSGIAANEANLDGPLVFARYIEGSAQLLVDAHPTLPPYIITWDGSALVLGRLAIDRASAQIAYTPLSKGDDPGYRIGTSSVFAPLNLRGGAALQGGIDQDGKGNIYALNSVGHEILVFDSAGVLRRRVCPSHSFGPAAIRNGHGLAVDRDGTMYVTDLEPPGLVRLNADGSFAWRVSQSAPAKGAQADAQAQRLVWPFDAAILPSGDLIVTDAEAKRLHVVRPDGTLAGYFGGDSPTYRLERPYGVAVGPNGNVFVSDFGLKALLELNGDGKEVRRWPLPLQRVEHFEVPYVAVDQRGHAYVTDHSGWLVYHADPARTDIQKLNVLIPHPSGLMVRGDELLVIEAGGQRLQRVPLP